MVALILVWVHLHMHVTPKTMLAKVSTTYSIEVTEGECLLSGSILPSIRMVSKKTPSPHPPLVHLLIPSPTVMLSIDSLKSLCVNLFPRLAFVETVWPTFGFQMHSWDLAPSFQGMGTLQYSGNTPLHSISENYISLEFFNLGKYDSQSQDSEWSSQQIKFIAQRNSASRKKLRCQ